jgi:hypothetical protein
MNREYDEDEIENLLRDHLAAELDTQRGRARRAFEAHVAHVARTGVGGASRAPAHGVLSRERRARLWVVGAVGTAVAASLAGLWAVPVARTGNSTSVMETTTGGAPRAENPGTQPQTPHLVSDPAVYWERTEQLVSSVTLDKGTVVVDDDTPVRVIRRVAVERTQWVDPRRGVTVEAVVPHEDVKLIVMDTY